MFCCYDTILPGMTTSFEEESSVCQQEIVKNGCSLALLTLYILAKNIRSEGSSSSKINNVHQM